MIEKLKTQFKLLMGEVHVRYGFLETEFQEIWYCYNIIQNPSNVEEINKKFIKIKKLTLGRLIQEIDKLSIYSSRFIKMIKNETKHGRNYYAHRVQEIFYDELGKTDKQNEREFKSRLIDTIDDLKRTNKKLITITNNLMKKRFRFYKMMKKS